MSNYLIVAIDTQLRDDFSKRGANVYFKDVQACPTPVSTPLRRSHDFMDTVEATVQLVFFSRHESSCLWIVPLSGSKDGSPLPMDRA